MNKLNFILKQFPDPSSFSLIKEDFIISLNIPNLKDIENVDLNKFHQKEIYLNRQFYFSFHFDLNNDSKELYSQLLEGKQYFLQLIFHPNFKRIGNKPLFFFTGDDRVKDFVKEFQHDLIDQGFDGLEYINYLNDKPDMISYEFDELNNFHDFYYKLVSEKQCVGNYIGIINNTDKSITEILEVQHAAEEKFKYKLPSQYAFLEKYILLKQEVEHVKEKLIKTEEDLLNQKKYLSIMKTKDQANQINNFYYYEYEILPLWYKKMGHLLKVITGKRSFRSLFDNNVKKYKD